MTLTELKYIVADARERHYGRAPQACFVSQPTLSVAIRKLEDELGVTLFERETFHSALYLGKRVLTHLGHDEAEAEQLARDFHARDLELLQRAFDLRDDREAYWGMVRQSMTLLDEAMQADAPDTPETAKKDKGPGKLDKSRLPRSG